MIRKVGEGSILGLLGGRVIREAGASSARRLSPVAGDSGLGTGLVLTLDGVDAEALRRRTVRRSPLEDSLRGGSASQIRPVRR